MSEARVAYSIKGVPERGDWAHGLAEQLGDKAVVGIDHDRKGAWDNHRDTMREALKFDADWVVDVDDDAELCDGFADLVPGVLAKAPGPIVTFVSQEHDARTARCRGASWVKYRYSAWGIGVALRRDLVDDYLTFGDSLYHMPQSVDTRLVFFANFTDLGIWATAPNLLWEREGTESAIRPGRSNPVTGIWVPWLPNDPTTEWNSKAIVGAEGLWSRWDWRNAKQRSQNATPEAGQSRPERERAAEGNGVEARAVGQP